MISILHIKGYMHVIAPSNYKLLITNNCRSEVYLEGIWTNLITLLKILTRILNGTVTKTAVTCPRNLPISSLFLSNCFISTLHFSKRYLLDVKLSTIIEVDNVKV